MNHQKRFAIFYETHNVIKLFLKYFYDFINKSHCFWWKNCNKYSNKTSKTFEPKKQIFRVSELVVGFSEQDIASHLSSKLWKISMFVFGSNENFKICFWDLLTFSIYIFVNLQFWYFSYSLTQYLAHRIQHPIPKLRKFRVCLVQKFY